MRLLNIENVSFNLQKVQFSVDIYNKYATIAVAILNVARTYKILAKVHLHEDINIKETIFVSKTVIIPLHGWRQFDFNDVQLNLADLSTSCIEPVKTTREAEKVNIIIVYKEPKHVTFGKTSCGTVLVKNFLKQIIIANGSIVLGSSLPELNIFAIIISNIGGKPCETATVNSRTQIVVDEVMSLDKLKVIVSLPKAIEEEKLFLAPSSEVNAFRLASRVVDDIVNATPKLHASDNKLLLVGPSGCGKTSLLSAVARKSRRILLKLDCGDTNDSTILTELKSIFERAKAHEAIKEQCIVLLKNIDVICRMKSAKSNRYLLLMRQVACIIEEMNSISVVATSDSPEHIPPVLKKYGCFNQEIEIAMLTEDDRCHVFLHFAKLHGFECSNILGKKLAEWTPGYILTDLLSVLRESISLVNYNQDLTEEILKKAVSKTLPSLLRGTRGLITTRKTTFGDIAGLENVKKELNLSVLWQLKHREAFERLGIESTRGVLLYGPPGCAKTTLAKALANESGATFLAVSSADLYSPYVGESEKRITKLFMQARIGAPSIIFIDEIDALVGSKGANRESGVQERILATLLMEMDGIGVNTKTSDSLLKVGDEQQTGVKPTRTRTDNNTIIVIGATNRPELLDDALKRPGRFDNLIHIPLPNKSDRLAILKSLTSKMPLDSDVDFETLVERTEKFSGADLKHICAEAALSALTARGMDTDKILFSDFVTVLERTLPMS